MPAAPRTQDPRRARSREAMLRAAVRLLESDGPTAVTPARVATAAGVHRATVYRHWPDADRLLDEALAEAELPFFRDPTSPIRDWLRLRLRELADDLATPASQGVTSTVMHAALWRPEIAAQRDALAAAMENRLRAAMELAVERGELAASRDSADIAAELIGPLLYRTLLQAATVGDSMVDRLVEQALRPDR